MRLFRFFAVLALPFAVVGHLITRAAVFAVAMLEALSDPAHDFHEHTTAERVLTAGGAAGITPDLYQRNRHEAGVSRRSAARNT